MSGKEKPAGLYPWADAIAIGLGVFRIPPSSFWAMTPAEFAFLTGSNMGLAPRFDRAALDSLIEKFPDGSTSGDNKHD